MIIHERKYTLIKKKDDYKYHEAQLTRRKIEFCHDYAIKCSMIVDDNKN